MFLRMGFAIMRKGEKMDRILNEDDVLKEIDRWIGYLDEDMITRIKIGIRKIPSAQPEYEELTPEEAASEIASGSVLSASFWLGYMIQIEQMGYAICRKKGLEMI